MIKSGNTKIIIFLLVVIFSLTVIIVIQEYNKISLLSDIIEDLKIGANAPNCESTDIHLERCSFPEKNISYILFFFNTTCSFCKKSLPAVSAASENLDGRTIKMIGICFSSKAITENYLKEFNVKFPVIADSTGKIFREYRVRYVPQMIWVKPNMTIGYIQAYGEKTTHALSMILKLAEEAKNLGED